MNENRIDMVYNALKNVEWDKKIKRVDVRYAGTLILEEDMEEIEVRREEMRNSLRQTLKEIEVYEKMSGRTEFSSLEELIDWAKDIYGTGFEGMMNQ